MKRDSLIHQSINHPINAFGHTPTLYIHAHTYPYNTTTVLELAWRILLWIPCTYTTNHSRTERANERLIHSPTDRHVHILVSTVLSPLDIAIDALP